MSASGWVDLIVIVAALLAAASGYRQGAVASSLAFIGVMLGAVAGILLAPHIISRFDDRTIRLLVGVGVLVVLVIIGEVSGMMLGRAMRSGIRSPFVRRVDSIIGSVVQALAVLIAAWLLAIPLSSSSQTQLASAVRDSRVLGGVNDLAPQWLRDLPSDFTALLNNSGLPEVIGPFGRTPVTNVGPPGQGVVDLPAVQRARAGVVKIDGVAPSCQQALEGSGFVMSPERVITNAHVVAGTRQLTVTDASGNDLPARAVLFDSRTDIAVLDVPGLTAPALPFADSPARNGDDAVALGFPEAGPFTASAVRVREVINLSGPDIYQTGQILREVYTVRGIIRQGNSGGPLINSDGQVIGVIFGAAEDTSDETGFALTNKQIQPDLTAAEDRNARVSTQTCVHP